MMPDHDASLETRPSLLRRLQSRDDAQSWQDFYRIYGGLIRHFATRAGLTEDEAEEVVQETAIGVARRLPEFVYDPKVCRFKTWLLNLTRWRIQDQLRRRKAPGSRRPSDARPSPQAPARADLETPDETATLERIPDPAVPEFGADWDAAWEKNLLAKALEQVRAQINERQFQIFDCCVNKGWAPAEVAQTFGISVARVYLTKHRVTARLKQEVEILEKLAESPAFCMSVAAGVNATGARG